MLEATYLRRRKHHVRTLLIVGGDDLQVIDLNEQAIAKLNCEKQLRIIPGATHLFEEPGALEWVGRLARDWFERHLPPAALHLKRP